MAWFTVQYRDKSGAKAEAEFEASDRSALFIILKEKNITAVTVRSGRKAKTDRAINMTPRLLRWIIFGFIVTIGIAVIVVWLAESRKKEVKPQKVDIKAPAHKEDRVVISHPPAAVKAQEVMPAREMYMGKEVVSHTYITNKSETSVREIIKTADGRKHGVTRFLNKSIFNHVSDQMLADVLFPPNGKGTPPPLPPLDEKILDKRFFDSLKDAIVINPDDSDDVAAKKRAVLQARNEVKDLMSQNGCSFLSIIQHERTAEEDSRKMQLIVRKEMQRIRLEGGSVADELEYLEKANKILENNGINPVERSIPTRRKGSEK